MIPLSIHEEDAVSPLVSNITTKVNIDKPLSLNDELNEEEIIPPLIVEDGSNFIKIELDIDEPLSIDDELKEYIPTSVNDEGAVSSLDSNKISLLDTDKPLRIDHGLKEGENIPPSIHEEGNGLSLTSNININNDMAETSCIDHEEGVPITPSIHVQDTVSSLASNTITAFDIQEPLSVDQEFKEEEFIHPSMHEEVTVTSFASNVYTGFDVDEPLDTDHELKEGEFIPPSVYKESAGSSLPSDINTDIDIDEALKKLGSCGRFQYATQILITYLVITFGYQSVLSYFIANDPPWKCIRNNTSTFCNENFGVSFAFESKNFSRRCNLNRNEWIYTTDKKYSIVTEFDLVCGKTSIAAFASSIYHVGGGVGIFISGIAADHFGRKYVLIGVLSLLTAFSIICSYVSNSLQIIILRAFVGAGTVSCYNISYNYLSELVSPNYRTPAAIIYGLGFAFSQIILDAAAYYCRYWRVIQLYASLPCILGIVFLFFLPESPRWQLVNRKRLQAENTLKKIGMFNGSPVPSLTLKSPTAAKERKYTYCDLARSWKVAVVTMSQAFIWLTIEMCYYTIAFESSNLGGNMYQAFGLSALAEIPSKCVACYTCNRFGRKRTTLLALLLTGVFLVSTLVIPHTLSSRYLLNIVMMMLAKFFIDLAEQSVYMWTFELFPTVLRLQGTGVCIVCARIGSFAAPFLTTVLQQVNAVLPYIILTTFALLAAVCGLFLPETNKQPTRETYEDFFETPTRSNTVSANTDENTSRHIQMNDVSEEI